jgi:hypothetical protein
MATTGVGTLTTTIVPGIRLVQMTIVVTHAPRRAAGRERGKRRQLGRPAGEPQRGVNSTIAAS